MEKENKFKLKIPRIFTSSCKTQDLSEVIDHKVPIFTPENTIYLHTPLTEVVAQQKDDNPYHSPVIKPKQTPSSSSSMMYCKPRCPETFDQMVRENCIIAGNPIPRRKIAGRYSLLSPEVEYSGGRRCPPASPATPLFSQKNGKKKKKKKKYYKNENTLLKKNGNPDKHLYSSSNDTDNGNWFSSDDEREEDERENLFSLKSVSFSSKSISLSSDSDHPNNRVRSRMDRTRPRPRTRRRNPSSRLRKESRVVEEEEEEEEVGVMTLEGKVKDTFAVVKSSSDPYNDFRTSMVEMIIEKQIFGAKELEQLLQCFLSLNSSHHHRVIVEVFTEIWDALFSYCS